MKSIIEFLGLVKKIFPVLSSKLLDTETSSGTKKEVNI